MKRVFSILTVLLLLCVQNVHAQKLSIRGIVEDGEGTFIERAAIRLYNNDSVFIAGVVTNQKGRFSIDNIDSGKYKMIISHLGYKNRSVALPEVKESTNIGVVTLAPMSVELETVTVNGSAEHHKDDKVLIYPSMEQKKYAATGYGLLNNMMLPTVFVNMTSNVVTSYLGKVSLCINGREVGRKEILALPPHEVLRVEYQDTPNNEFSGTVVVNFITIKREIGGYAGISLDQRRMGGEYMATGKMHYKNSEFSLIYSPSYVNDKKRYSHVEEKFEMDGGSVVRNWQGTPSKYKEDTHQLNLNYFLRTEKHELNVALDYWRYNNPIERKNGLRTYAGMYNEAYQAFLTDKSKIKEPSLEINYNYKITDRHRLRFYLYADYTDKTYNYEYAEKGENRDESVTLNRSMEGTYWIANLYYQYIINAANTLQIQTSYLKQDADFRYINGFDYKDNQMYDKYFMRLTYTKRWEKALVTLIGGLSNYNYKSSLDGKMDELNKELAFFLRYAPNKAHVFNLKSQFTTGSPTLEQLSSVEQPVDFMQVQRGNAMLENESRLLTQAAYWLTVGRSRFYFAAQHTAAFNSIQKNVLLEGNKFVHTYTSDNDQHSLKLLATTVRNFCDEKLSLRLSGNYTRYWVPGTDVKLNTWYAEGSANYKHRAILLSAYAKSTENILAGNGVHYRFGSIHGLSLSYVKDGLLLTIGTENPFYKNHTDHFFHTNVYRITDRSFDRTNSKVFFVRSVWNFSFGKKHKYKEINLERKKGSIDPF
ncbi:carboxypeptidase regulatory-like domain-containing protein [Bacteroides sp. 214]|uniref:TonB-dependent receptor n=1 Tax=Bacteroides sp. 214 TaxID=2302935 RepID=UPI0013D5B07D|nr:carboxypeptidase-like regulatory domain-containing protein [Bacteroides sp. 214]NDW13783.1 carboxypeptidase regulatory-like domain-containing protein [Bacteroides sp. 214]